MCAKDSDHHGESRLPEYLRDPIEFLYGEHERLRLKLDEMLWLAENLKAENAPDKAASILEYLTTDLPIHLMDEEEDLFPLLRLRSERHEKIVATIQLLIAEHQNDVEVGRSMLRSLEAIAKGNALADEDLFVDYVRAFTMLQRRHHAMENTVLMPIAYERLTKDDLAELSLGMARRRGLTP
jgi:hemerythrin-like domain-containing protein